MKTRLSNLTLAFIIFGHLFGYSQSRTMESVYQGHVSHPENALIQKTMTLLSDQKVEYDDINSRSNQMFVLDSIVT